MRVNSRMSGLADVLDAIDDLVDVSTANGEPGAPDYPWCRCGREWHGLATPVCPGATIDGPPDLALRRALPVDLDELPNCRCGFDSPLVSQGQYRQIDFCIHAGPMCLNGYVRIPDGVDIDEDYVPAHGGITARNGQWIGFDTGHAGMGDWWTIEDRRRYGFGLWSYYTPGPDPLVELARSINPNPWTIERMQDAMVQLADYIADRSTSAHPEAGSLATETADTATRQRRTW